MAASSNATTFIELYNRLEHLIRQEYPDIPADRGALAVAARQKPVFSRMREELDYCREVRNLLQHSSRVGGEPLVSPSDALVDVLERAIEKVERPKIARGICTRKAELLFAEPQSSVRAVLEEMSKRSYTHVPVLDDGRVVGVFSANTLLAYLFGDGAQPADVAALENATFAQFGELLALDAVKPGAFAFVGEETNAYEVAELFKVALRERRRLHMVFVTAHGKRNERLLGIITAWDMAGFF